MLDSDTCSARVTLSGACCPATACRHGAGVVGKTKKKSKLELWLTLRAILDPQSLPANDSDDDDEDVILGRLEGAEHSTRLQPSITSGRGAAER